MEPTIDTGDLIVINQKDKKYNKNDIITFKDVNSSYVTHRIIKIDGKKIITKGDNNNSKDEGYITKDKIVGKYVFKINKMGFLVKSIKNPVTLTIIFIIGIIICIIISTDKDGIPLDISEEEKKYLKAKEKAKKVLKKLLHSKSFKKNLRKWIFIYCSVMFVLTIVITYSRYISSKAMVDRARAAKFDVKVSYDSCPSDISGNVTCFDDKMTEARPADKVNFYYTVDTSGLEVATKLVTTIKINNKKTSDGKLYFSNFKLYNIDDGKETPVDITSSEDSINSIENITLGKGKKKQYKLVMDYAYQDVGYSEPIVLENEKFISVDYSATQID